MPSPIKSAEDIISGFRSRVLSELRKAEDSIVDRYASATEQEQIAMITQVDQAAETERALRALDAALGFLSRAEEPVHDSPESYYGGTLRVGG